jgi:hypothetical protein
VFLTASKPELGFWMDDGNGAAQHDDEQNENRHNDRENHGRISLVVPGPLSPRGERQHPNRVFRFRGEPKQEKSNGF